jgi:hypothetical protein
VDINSRSMDAQTQTMSPTLAEILCEWLSNLISKYHAEICDLLRDRSQNCSGCDSSRRHAVHVSLVKVVET